MLEFVGRYARNLAIVAALLGGLWLVLRMFDPTVATGFTVMGRIFDLRDWWPALLALVLLLALPWRKP